LQTTILVTDDEPTTRSLLRLILLREAYQVFEAVDGLDALEQIEASIPDVLILDVMMPNMNGFEVCQRLRADDRTASLPILMLSAKTDEKSIGQGLAAGATRYLTKPISTEVLIENVREVIVNAVSDI
jgi:DNA-binding response OmpR family regulator